MISKSLFLLVYLQYKAFFRNTLRGLKTWRGIFYTIITVGLISLWLSSQIISIIYMQKSKPPFPPETIKMFIPFGLLLYCVMNVVSQFGEKAIYFTPPEISHLFTGPFKRSELLLFKLFSSAINVIFVALMMSFFTMRFSHHFLALFIGAYLCLLFLQNFATLIILLKQIVVGTAYTRVRQSLLTFVGVLFIVGVWQISEQALALGIIESVKVFHESIPGKILLSLFVPFRECYDG
jgi:hypothetical protein